MRRSRSRRGRAICLSEVTRLVLVRHGATAHSLERRFAGRNAEPLVEEGRAMAERAAERLRSLEGVGALYTSPLRRALQTAAPIAAALGLAPLEDGALAEADFGAWDGLPFAEVLRSDTEAFTRWFSEEGAAGGTGESLAEVAERAEAWMARALEAHRGSTVVAISHAGPIKAALRHALGATWGTVYRMQQDHGSISVVEHSADGWWVRSVNDTAHLYGGGLPPAGRRPFGARVEGESRPGGRGPGDRIEESRASTGQGGG